MIMMGGVLLAALLIPLIAVVKLTVALISALTGDGADLLKRLLPLGIPAIRAVTDPPPTRKIETPSAFEPLGTRQAG
jgi:hypothetical protein